MKKLILITLAILIAQILLAQPGKGKIFVGGTFSASKTDTPTIFSNEMFDKNFNLTISPNVGYFISDKMALGASLNYGYYNYSNESSINSGNVVLNMNGKNYGGSLFARYYKPLTEKLFFTINGSIGYSYGITNSETFYSDINFVNYKYEVKKERRNNSNINLSPGFEYFVTPRLGLSTNIGYMSYSLTQSKNQSGIRQNSSNFNINLFPINFSNIAIGLKYYF